MAETILTIVRGKQVRQVPLDPKGLILGRSKGCDVTLESPRVSRKHARIFSDPFGRWLIQDLGSRNGIKLDGERVDVHAMQPGRAVEVGPFVLSLPAPEVVQIDRDPKVTHTTTTYMSNSAGTEVLRSGTQGRANLSRARLRNLNAIADRLAGLTRPAMLYPELCRGVARAPGSAALVVRIVPGEDLPEVLACHLGGRRRASAAAGPVPLSRRVVEAVRDGEVAVMAASRPGEEGEIGLTIVDEAQPRTVFCGRIGEGGQSIEALYVDLPADQSMPDMFDFLQAVTRQASLARKSVLLARAEAEHEQLEQQLALARTIQAKLAPTEFDDIGGLDVAVHYEPAMWVGGDYCDVWPVADGRLALAVGDVAGKGLPAAMAMANLQAALRTTLAFSTDLAEVADKINELVVHNLPERMFVTMFLGLLRPADGTLEYVNAGHLPPLAAAPDGVVSPLAKASGMPLGVETGDFETGVLTLAPGTRVVLVTDGITESTSPGGKLFGSDRLAAAVADSQAASARELVEAVVKAAAEFRGSCAQQDDATVLALVVGS